MALAALALFGILSTPSSASAEVDSRLGLHFRNVVSGKKAPAIVIQPQAALKQLTVSLSRADGKKSTVRSGPVAAGTRKEIPVKQPAGTFGYRGKFKATYVNGDKSSFDMTFEMTRVGKLKLQIDPKDVDLDARSMTFRINNPAALATLTFVGSDGVVMETVKRDLKGTAAGAAITLNWKKLPRDLLHADLKVTDVAGFWKGVRMTPFAIEIPHDDVVFDTDRWDIKRSEEPKLKKTLGLIREALQKHGTLLQLKLFVAGYTDTVGGKRHNQRLSENRARSIASWFRRNGLRCPIFHQGFGEEVLKVKTPDNTDEERNRRALYLLASQIPGKSRELPKSDWKKP